MITREMRAEARKRARNYLSRAGVTLTPEESATIEIADFGLGDLARVGLEVVVYVNTQRCCAKELVLFPRQTCPEHWHPPVGDDPGKEETFRCRWGEVYLYVPGEPAAQPGAVPPAGREEHYQCRHEIRLRPGDQYTMAPGTPHWFQAGDEGAVVTEFSTTSRDELDVFRDPAIVRVPEMD